MLRKLICALTAAVLLILCQALADEAADITKKAKFTASNDKSILQNLSDGNYKTGWSTKKGYTEITLPDDTPCCGLYVCQSGTSVPYAVQLFEDGGWNEYTQHDEEYLHLYTELPGVTKIRIQTLDSKQKLTISEIKLYGEGDTPDSVQQWETLDGKADMLLLSAHPDDEYIWFGGTLPMYAGERQKKVQVIYLSVGENRRKSELLDGLWTAGVHYYPVIGEYKDFMSYNRQTVYQKWGGTKKVYPWYVTFIRKYQPDVIVTHDMEGEYGHAAHQVAAYMNINCIDKAADPEYHKTSYEQYGAWQVKKLYLHLYSENEIVMDWQQPLEHFGGRTAFEVATDALAKHYSQRAIAYHMEEFGPWDCRKFGLYMSTVGEDVEKNDFFEHID